MAQTAKRNYKDGLFRVLFNDKEKLIELYNAVSGSNYPKETPVEIITLEDSIFGGLKNDLAFVINNRLIILIEHQSTINPNMPLRMLCYIAKEYERLLFSRGIYSRRPVPIPTPELYVFYNGTEDLPLEQELKLSDSFVEKCGKIALEAVVRVINVNYEKGAELLQRCETLREYSQFMHDIRVRYRRNGDLTAAIRESVKYCMDHNVLRDFLKRNGGDMVSFLFEELSREECEAIREEDGYERGKVEGIEKGEMLKLIAQVQKKAGKGQSAEKIAEDLLEEPETVKAIFAVITEHPAWNGEQIYKHVRGTGE
ncbi:Rpn family recombination-promoting nuclease/putative transposase [Anaerovorax odorimutans]|uniref:Rpn family recombination-promoting nuclease/putative transposase n=1 Tax=Anaerovorax odorimutans TaxID=109327 RepID=A0ABT1RMK3_9FIRM|nr:Rpn family recombination-promoting nuclease/putative transposase [Anaerovorax odorimutans]MCQ4636413.1 Rpn family recombination-promoting nuclease/putative transposase [Anaerovorax odorimutans]